MKTKFEDLEAGDTILKSVWGYVRHDYFLVKVVKRTKTRIFTTYRQFDHDHEEAWNLDGSPYPRPSSYSGRKHLMLCTPEHIEAYDRNKAMRRVENSAYRLAEKVRKTHWSDQMTEMDLRNLADVCEKYLTIMAESEEKKA